MNPEGPPLPQVRQMTMEFIHLLTCTDTGCPPNSSAGGALRLQLGGPVSLSEVALQWAEFICTTVESTQERLVEILMGEQAGDNPLEDGEEERDEFIMEIDCD